MPGLENYRALVARVEEICGSTFAQFASSISCRPGCDACCRHLTVFAVEAAALREALSELSEEEARAIRVSAQGSTPDGPCPLLSEGLCLLYRARPIICRTHGLPLLVKNGAEQTVDFCPENFRDLSSIPGSAVIDLERLNAALTAINALYLKSFPGPERVGIGAALGTL